jgi:hypothetical protein
VTEPLSLGKSGTREAGPMEIELRVCAPAEGSVELAWDDEQQCG